MRIELDERDLTNPDTRRMLRRLLDAMEGVIPTNGTQPRAEQAPSAPVAARKPKKKVSWEQFREGLTKQTNAFLDFVEEEGEVDIDQVVGKLGLSQPKSVGGLVGALNRKIANYDLPNPLKMGKVKGKRVFRWVGE